MITAWALIKKLFNLPTLVLVALGGIIYALGDTNYASALPFQIAKGVVGGLGFMLIVFLVLAMSNGLFLSFLRHLISDPAEPYATEFMRRVMTVAAFVFTTGFCLIWAATYSLDPRIIAAPWSIFVGIATYRAFPSFAGTPDKAKRKEKNAPAM